VKWLTIIYLLKKGTVSKSKWEESKPTDKIKHMCKQILW
jgi:hypothetical protein